MSGVPYARLSGFYALHFAVLGAFVPFWSLYLEHLGLDKFAIGQMLAIIMGTKVFSPYLWGWVADRTGHHLAVIITTVAGSLASFALTLWVTGFWPLALVTGLFGFFWHAALPQFEAVTMDFLGDAVHRYSQIRLWGSLGFIAVVLLAPLLLEARGVAFLPQLVLVLLALLLANALLLPRPPELAHESGQGMARVLTRPAVLAFLLVCTLQLVSHGPYYTFYTLYAGLHGYDLTAAGWLWALGVIAEVLLFLVMHRLLARHDAVRLLQLSVALTALRWGLIALVPDNLPLMLLAQVLHAASYGLFHASAIHLVYRLFSGRLRGRGQALYASASFGLGGAIGAFAGGYAWETWGPAWSFGLAALIALIALGVAVFGMRGLLLPADGRPSMMAQTARRP
ncbi:MAG: MFS transporter [Gammaproteobacteria bacterium]|nr:MAG: MFS transporter [Gammaproteobacteria bacterium]